MHSQAMSGKVLTFRMVYLIFFGFTKCMYVLKLVYNTKLS